MNNPSSTNKFVPKQALAPTPQLYDELVGDSMEKLALASISQLAPIPSGSIIHDNGCGTGAGTAAIVSSLSASDPKTSITIHGTDINPQALSIYRARSKKEDWPTQAAEMDSQNLSFANDTFSHSIGNALLFVLPNNGIDVAKETYRTLQPGGIAIFNTWCYVPTMPALQAAAKTTRPAGTPLPRDGMQKWADPEFALDVLVQGGFEKEKIKMTQAEVRCSTLELEHFSNMLWSFIGGTGESGWLGSDEERWDEAIEIIKRELRNTKDFKVLDGGRAELMFVANFFVAMK